MQHLQELGLDTSNASMVWGKYEGEEEYSHLLPRDENVFERCLAAKYIPAYTLQNVLDALPKDISRDGCTWSASLYIDFESNRIAYGNTDRYGFEVYHEIMIEKDLIDAAYEMLCWCIENGYAKIGKEASDERTDR